jgi:hypothetical protein
MRNEVIRAELGIFSLNKKQKKLEKEATSPENEWNPHS